MDDFIKATREIVQAAAARGTPLAIHGGNSKSFYGGGVEGDALDLRPHSGIIDYEPRELVLTVRAGTSLLEVENALAAERQLLPFEPPSFTSHATIGGAVAAGLSGPRRPYAGAVRDFVLGTRIIDGKGDDLQFGGRVIKNVAGYDVSRLMVGAMGTLGILTDLSFKVLPMPASEITLKFSMSEADAIQKFNEWAGQPLPISATAWLETQALVRLSGTFAGVKAAREKLGGEAMRDEEANHFWQSLRNHTHALFTGSQTLTRISLPPTTSPLSLQSPQLIEWGGGVRWLRGDHDIAQLRANVEKLGGHVTVFRHPEKTAKQNVFHPLNGKLAELNRNLKHAFDPHNILNRGRMDNF
jgi:glycolate oxidase FAD binding subunit